MRENDIYSQACVTLGLDTPLEHHQQARVLPRRNAIHLEAGAILLRTRRGDAGLPIIRAARVPSFSSGRCTRTHETEYYEIDPTGRLLQLQLKYSCIH